MSKEKDTINKQEIKEWKAEHGNVYKTNMCNDSVTIIWRRLKRKEYLSLMNETTEGDLSADEKLFKRQESMVNIVALYPENIKEVVEQNAGVATVLSDEILAMSGFEDPSTEEL